MDTREQQRKIEALLFFENREMSYKELAKAMELSLEEVREIVREMLPWYEGRGIQLVAGEESVRIFAAPDLHYLEFVVEEKNAKKELSQQALETLAIILYKGKLSKQEIDYIRGVNSTFILRNLRVRGFIDRERKGRESYYFATPELYAFLGIQSREQLPSFDELNEKLVELRKSTILEEGE